MMKRKYLLIILIVMISSCFFGCKKWVEVPAPTNSINLDNIFENDITAEQTVNGIYTMWAMKDMNSSISGFLSYYAGLSADEYFYSTDFGGDQLNYYQNKITSKNTTFWNEAFINIQICNTSIEGLTISESLSPAVKKNLLGQVKFLRAFYYFYLINLFGEVPLITGTDYKKNRVASRQSVDLIYQQIIGDLKDAEKLLPATFTAFDGTTNTSERILPNTWAAKALLARVYLYRQDYANADIKSSELINNTDLFSLEDLNNVFLKNNREAIWQLQPVNSGWNTEDAKLFIIPTTGLNSSHPLALSNSLLNAFEPGDQRKTNWVGVFIDNSVNPSNAYYYAFKYKAASQGDPVTEYESILRLGEQYLIRAEARAHLNSPNAISDLNKIRNRAGLPNYNLSRDNDNLLTAIMHERQVELFSEWGHRWLDLKRSNNLDKIMSTASVFKGGSWDTNMQLFPIPASEIIYNPNLKQNPGY